ncbi:hypothetical protein [Dethiobacter alkaliphilus]|uniref:Uncharacterized protein n=1 Tax=Dethiobacter alkaliphilus AHT 1 TaxID=555088 RepID=C0GKT5_DETAL|nr:hypothetical protein [Dethiobacter alkaliphilus]EEG76054.1 hypothetical protein DealDRAFT_3094 [Dethiobacter alkaliphilus AHT 1]
MKPIKIDSKAILLAINSGKHYIQVDGRRFLLLEVEEIDDSTLTADMYKVTDPEEEKLLLGAIKNDNPILSAKEIDQMLEE